ncbi:hypothetical protein [Geobacter sp. DSM 9736]|uniref:hypothetical protein n=1 Tax=Geobacter sp. DSM 9736 TaxID=1277350 RepID=UPI000B50886C|nr:hypothetical protein [Geobacter sp. DSM 9736]SNB44866.1 hypothetical protein SAMN06269301_0256 [Geobacter sp. DSM 9736]
MERKAVIVCPGCKRVKRFGAWIELTYNERLVINGFTTEEIGKMCEECLDAQKKLRIASNA